MIKRKMKQGKLVPEKKIKAAVKKAVKENKEKVALKKKSKTKLKTKIKKERKTKVAVNEKLTNKELLFCKIYPVNFNGSKSVIEAGFTKNKNSAKVTASQLLTKPNIQVEIKKNIDKRLLRVELTADMVLNELQKLAFSNIQNLYDTNGDLIPISELDADVAASVQEVTEDTIGELVIRRKHKISDKKASLELLGKYFGIFQDNVNHKISGGVLIVPGTSEDTMSWEERVIETQRKLAEGDGE